MTYAEAVSRLLALRGGEQAGMRPGLDRIEALLDALGHPERQYSIIQVGGTNGKGSVAVMTAAILKTLGRRVGLYTSPHLCSFRERIRVNGRAIPEDDVVDGVEALGTLVARLDATMFEAATALALDHFAREGVEWAVLEVGMGGRLDATTVGVPRASVITRIDYDHQAFLGWRLEEIAREKAAIIRSGHAVAAAQVPEVVEILVGRAGEAGVPIWLHGRHLRVMVRARDLSGQRLDLSGPGWELSDCFVPLLGGFQAENALLAVAAVKALSAMDLQGDDRPVREGLARVSWPGRFEVIGRDPWVILDGAHNPAGAQAVAGALEEYFPGSGKTLVVGISSDKDRAGILKALLPVANRLILTASSNPRATPPEELRALLPPSESRVELASDVVQALSMALTPPVTPIICVTGSLFLVADMLRQAAGGRDIPCEVERGADSIKGLLR
ncbi:MAG: bifunctional folylpolyglutamate synthase/dihydrofolate synthase [Candidatus Rokubacteria bacterium]|nr:bifunctional folylpolyglutamate synthase/dihydrofolate synthase [Candidatus Rokubacteria bacterium]